MTITPNAKVLFGILLVILVPAALTLSTVNTAGVWSVPSNPTPFGYTQSLFIYIVPILTMYLWFQRIPSHDYRRRAYRWTVGLLVPVGFLLDVVLGNTLLTFPDPDATLGIFLPGYSFAEGRFIRNIPIEEFVFYVTGFMAILLAYVWCDEYWLSKYNVNSLDAAHRPAHVLRLHPPAAIYGIVAIVAAILYRFFGFHDPRAESWPVYFVFLVAAAVIPALVGFRATQAFINWRAFSLTLMWVLLTSLLWEVTLAVPYGWWGYEHRFMLGIFVDGWHDLPIEAVMLWLVVTFTVVVAYEAIKIVLTADQGTRQALIGDHTIASWVQESVRRR